MIFFLAALFAGCATTYVNLSGLTAEQVAENIEGQSGSFASFTSTGYGNFETPQGSFNARFELSIQRPSQAMVNLYGPFGIKVAKVRITSDTLIVYNSIKNQVFVGKPSASNLGRLLMVATNGSSFTDLLLGFMVPLAHLDKPDSSSSYDGKVADFTYVSQDTVEKYTVDGEYLRTTEYRQTIAGDEVMKIEYSNFTKIDQIYFPRSISFEDARHQVSARLYYQDITLNQKDDFELNVPPDAQEVILN